MIEWNNNKSFEIAAEGIFTLDQVPNLELALDDEIEVSLHEMLAGNNDEGGL